VGFLGQTIFEKEHPPQRHLEVVARVLVVSPLRNGLTEPGCRAVQAGERLGRLLGRECLGPGRLSHSQVVGGTKAQLAVRPRLRARSLEQPCCLFAFLPVECRDAKVVERSRLLRLRFWLFGLFSWRAFAVRLLRKRGLRLRALRCFLGACGRRAQREEEQGNDERARCDGSRCNEDARDKEDEP
jgi:hypothetical protein